MAKTISPLLFRFKYIPNYLNNIHIKLLNSKKFLTYFKFFKILLNFIYLFRAKISMKKIFSSKFLYLKCNYNDFYNINIALIFYKLKKHNLKSLYKEVIKLFTYINYTLRFNYHIDYYFVFLRLQTPKYIQKNIKHLLMYIKNTIKYKKNFKVKIIYFLNSLLQKYSKSEIRGIKCIYSGCLHKNSKKKSFKYSKGDISTSAIITNILYDKLHIKTRNGVVGIKLWVHK